MSKMTVCDTGDFMLTMCVAMAEAGRLLKAFPDPSIARPREHANFEPLQRVPYQDAVLLFRAKHVIGVELQGQHRIGVLPDTDCLRK